MNIKISKFVGDESQFTVEHRLLNIILILSSILAIWSSLTNYLLHLDDLLVLVSVISSIILAGVYYLSFVKKKYSTSILVLIIFAVIIIPIAWVLNGGISGSIPFYIVTFSSIGAVIAFGSRRIALIIYFVVISSILVPFEYNYPSIIRNYSSVSERYIDIFIGLITTIIFNTVIILVILNYYNQEHKKAKIYLKESLHAQENLMYLSYHDALTGLYNRAYFEKVAATIEHKTGQGIGVFTVDLDGLKFANDTMGHEQGDLLLKCTAKILQASFLAQDTIARIGGDEFAIIVQEIAQDDMETLYKRIYDNIQRENEQSDEIIVLLNMSIGYAYSADASKSISNLLHEADRKMYREKLYHKSETEGSIIQTVKKMLSARDCDNGKHSKKLQKLIADFAIAVGLPKSEIADIQLFAEFHDIGKIGIPDHILHKAESLTTEERNKIQQHCEIGYRIAKSSNDLLPIADLILKHHEWWNGEGYPLGIKGNQIPIECRIVAIADAYDAMTNDRPYRKAMSHESAIKELKDMADIQFDYELVKKFITTECVANYTKKVIED